MSQRIRQNVTQEQLNTGQTDVLDDSITVAWQHETSEKYSQINYFKFYFFVYTGQTDVLDDSITVAWQHETSEKYSQINYFKLLLFCIHF